MPDDRKYTEKEKLDWLEGHVEHVRREAGKDNFRFTLALKAHISAFVALQEKVARGGQAPEPLPCNGCTFFGRGYYSTCEKCCRGKRDLLAEARAKAEQREEGTK